jgi:SAM-dependent methyltransferase
VGGEPYYWKDFPVKCEVVCLNIHPSYSNSENVRFVQYDGHSIPYKDQSFDVVHSNSVIEHVGDFKAQLHFAGEIRRVGKRYWVQVPNYYFPWEPHAFLPCYQFLPANLKMLVRQYWTKPPYDIEDLLSIRLLSVREVRYLFPRAKIYRERFMGLTKSICAYE